MDASNRGFLPHTPPLTDFHPGNCSKDFSTGTNKIRVDMSDVAAVYKPARKTGFVSVVVAAARALVIDAALTIGHV